MTQYGLSNMYNYKGIHKNIRLWMFMEHEFTHEQFCFAHQFICLIDTGRDPLICTGVVISCTCQCFTIT